MIYTYKQVRSSFTGNITDLIKRSDDTTIPFDLANTDYQAYIKWLEEGNIPEAAD